MRYLTLLALIFGFSSAFGGNDPDWYPPTIMHYGIPWSQPAEKPRTFTEHSETLSAEANTPEQQTKAPTCKNADYVFIGGGPIGLYTAVQLKIHHPQSEVCIYEKYSTYQRKRKLQLHRQSFDNAAPNKAFRKVLAEFKGSFLYPIKSVETAELESKLKGFAKSIGIQITTQQIHSILDVKKDNPQATAIVGSDGAHSMVRKSEFTEAPPKVYQYVVEVQYEVEGKSKRVGQFMHLLTPSLHHLVRETISSKGKLVEANVPSGEGPVETSRSTSLEGSIVTLRMMVSQEEYDALKDKTSFKHPMIVGSSTYRDSVPENLQETIQKWLELRKSIIKDEIIQDSPKLLTIPLAFYSSSHFYTKREDGPYVFLVGDAAFGVPFYRSINNGFESGNVLARVLAKLKNPDLKSPSVCSPHFTNTYLGGVISPLIPLTWLKQDTPDDYETFMKALESRESLAANTKNMFLAIQESVYSFYQNLDLDPFGD